MRKATWERERARERFNFVPFIVGFPFHPHEEHDLKGKKLMTSVMNQVFYTEHLLTFQQYV
jgi:hypothetical protein